MTASHEIERARRAYEERDAAPPSVYSWDNPGYIFYIHDLEAEVLRGLRDAGASLTGASVLEVGCGFGAILDRLRQFGASRAAGIDLSESRIAEARRRYPELELTAGDASGLPYADGEFDVVTQFVCLSSVLDPAVRRAIMAEMWRVTKPGGIVLSHDIRKTPAAIRTAGRLYGRLRGLSAAAADAGTAISPVTDEELRVAFPGARLRTVSLNFDLAAVAGRSVGLARALRAVPVLRTHTLALARKPHG
jgi:SAM-dependent methyltransferase